MIAASASICGNPASCAPTPASTTPVTLPGGAMSKMSSKNPVANTISAASAIPIGSELSSKMTSNRPINIAVSRATSSPTSMAIPPT